MIDTSSLVTLHPMLLFEVGGWAGRFAAIIKYCCGKNTSAVCARVIGRSAVCVEKGNGWFHRSIMSRTSRLQYGICLNRIVDFTQLSYLEAGRKWA
jgi:hypothetical protein